MLKDRRKSARRTPPLFFSLSFFNYIIFLNELLVYWTLEVHICIFICIIIIISIAGVLSIEVLIVFTESFVVTMKI